MDKKYSIISNSPAETIAFGKKLAELINVPALILLNGDLGTGKTLITKAAVSALGYQGDVTSPTFNLVQEYQAQVEIIHMDLYRLDRSEELLEIGFEDYLNREAVIFIEWPELALSLIPADFIFINIEKLSDNQREITVRGEGKMSSLLIERLNQEC
ncbi:ATPase YjeE, predicted to have essential role in cell wall biosynthesis [Halanaerobium saccharolyticum subsp. saccharolyticum DSM 6643]|jgi:tRNA threonylcarbamoyladenosine biosynthesis protein TsaE|uniref:tRNA threonylcarbamoyladenosine biosynthesis protein TsaE n=1 Tax=Halanaerobium saccharolyticum subsp. saccharolyticum DSM 6643 TaxID=1293054 RepID=M5EAH3_9FIRM|nr:bifunctional tRNA (adenosine(37)-N6)-threonylcarbamoyltransferase complex ATPase subunit type 1 TsaE/phosphotransferase [Halanaerobium saccharolyticum]CCU77740.1 ATPase YjeE, predicted to have essential role in cell wall biosynthesis [Halanaerobium saccharolyticum subsp. saccharolyticum DSM 6643]